MLYIRTRMSEDLRIVKGNLVIRVEQPLIQKKKSTFKMPEGCRPKSAARKSVRLSKDLERVRFIPARQSRSPEDDQKKVGKTPKKMKPKRSPPRVKKEKKSEKSTK